MEFNRVARYVATRSPEELVKVRDALKDNAQARHRRSKHSARSFRAQTTAPS